MEPDAIAAIRENAQAVEHLGNVLVSKDETARQLEEDRWAKQQARWDDEQERYSALRGGLKAVAVIVAVVAVLAAVVLWQTRTLTDTFVERSALGEAQRRCQAELTANALGRYRTQPVADPALLNGLREDLTASYLQNPPDQATLVRIRDRVRTIMGQVPTDDPILHIRELCYTGVPSEDPVHDQNTTPSSSPPTSR